MLLNTIEMNKENRAVIYAMLHGADVIQIKDSVGDVFCMKEVVMEEIEELDDKGEKKVLVAVLTTDGEVYQTLSPTVKDSIISISKYYNIKEENPRVKVVTGRSKGGRDFIQLDLCVGEPGETPFS